MLFQGEEDIEDFESALAAEPWRRRGERVPPGCRHAFGLLYRDLVHYAEQVERYLTLFGPDQIDLIIYDDFAADPAAVYANLLRSLGLDASHRPDFAVVNANKTVRSTLVRRALRTTSPRLRAFGRLLVPGAAARARLRRRAHSLNTQHRPRPALAAEVRARLAGELEDEVRRLEQLLSRDLSSWRPAVVGADQAN
jgi:hypothetical protein